MLQATSDIQMQTTETHYGLCDLSISANRDKHRKRYIKAYHPDIFYRSWDHNMNTTGSFDEIDAYGLSNVTTQSKSTRNFFDSFPLSKNFIVLKNSFDKQKHKASISQDVVNLLFEKLALDISELPFIKSDVEITSSDSIKVSMTFSDDILLIISKPFDSLEDVSEEDIVFSVFKNRKRLASDVAKTKTFVEGFKRFLSVPV